MRKIFVFAIAVLFVSILILGCEEQQTAGAGDKRGRLVGVENIELKNQLEQCNKKLEKQRKKFTKSQQDCQAQKQKMKDDVEKIGKNVIKDFEEMLNLRKENTELKARIKELEK